MKRIEESEAAADGRCAFCAGCASDDVVRLLFADLKAPEVQDPIYDTALTTLQESTGNLGSGRYPLAPPGEGMARRAQPLDRLHGPGSRVIKTAETQLTRTAPALWETPGRGFD